MSVMVCVGCRSDKMACPHVKMVCPHVNVLPSQIGDLFRTYEVPNNAITQL